MAQNKINMPGAFGGLMRYDEEYKSRFMLSPWHVIAFIIAITFLVILLKLFFPVPVEIISAPVSVPIGLILPMLGF